LRIEEKDIEVTMQIEDEILHVHEESIVQVCNNLIDNALRYYRGKSPINIIGKKTEQFYKMEVCGPSRAISENEKEILFERFFRTDPSRSKETGGAGLGLAISKEIIEHHGGKIELDIDNPFHTFIFTLPLQENI